MPERLNKILLILGIALILAAIPVFWLAYSAPNELVVSFLDVGQGDSILIKTPYGQNILIDGGETDIVLDRLGAELDWAGRTIDLMILTHPHSDHVGGLIDVLERYEVKKIIYSGAAHTSPVYLVWLDKIKEKNIPLNIIENEQTIHLGPECRLEILYPRNKLVDTDNLNNTSIVAKLEYKKTSFLFTGDAEEEVEKELLADNRISADVLKVGHHGSDTSSGEDFLNKVAPIIAVISLGADNQFGFPNQRVIKRLDKIGAKTYQTAIEGTINIKTAGEKYSISYN